MIRPPITTDRFFLVMTFAFLAGLTGCGSNEQTSSPSLDTKVKLGEQLFSDIQLSFNGTQSCATCHDPDAAFVDTRSLAGHGDAAFSASVGDDGVSLGDRNAPSAAYAFLSPEFQVGTRQRVASQRTSGVGAYEGYLGGQFWDGRESNLAGQAGGPPLNALEMGMPSKQAVVDVLRADEEYAASFGYLYGSDIFNDIESAYAAMADAIAAFEHTEAFAPFDSKYDRSLNFPATYAFYIESAAAKGKSKFFSSDLACASCHQLKSVGSKQEPFTSFEYHNLGVPTNQTLKAERESRDLVHGIDLGLANNTNIASEDVGSSEGKFKVPTLRNVAVTAPYMHNGVFERLDTVMRFYEHAKMVGRGETSTIVNPETGNVFADAEVADNISHDVLANNQINIDSETAFQLECFLMSLTDARYEHLLDAAKVKNCGL